MNILIGSDHAGYDYKSYLIKKLKNQGHKISDFGTDSEESTDYPDFAHPVAKAVEEATKNTLGILVCGSANGVAMTANKYKGIRAAIAWNVDLSRFARTHNDANIICIPARFISKRMAGMIVETFLEMKFEGCLLYTSPSPRDKRQSRMPSSA